MQGAPVVEVLGGVAVSAGHHTIARHLSERGSAWYGTSQCAEENMMTVRKRIRVAGHVQGVAFRAVTTATARELGLCGWVANRDDGRVEMVAEGDEGSVAALIQWCQQGPPGARVTRVEVRDEPGYSALPDPFTIRYEG